MKETLVTYRDIDLSCLIQ